MWKKESEERKAEPSSISSNTLKPASWHDCDSEEGGEIDISIWEMHSRLINLMVCPMQQAPLVQVGKLQLVVRIYALAVKFNFRRAFVMTKAFWVIAGGAL